MTSIELWGGVECTVNRVGDRYFDQLERCGHTCRLDDLDRFAELGIKALRFSALWERLAPDSLSAIDWSWSDAALGRLRALGIRPIVGFVHHGSGPRYTNLVQPSFATGLAQFARRFAERYPWVEAYTPVNEPLTTARFSGLYGLWYPHAHSDLTFLRILMNECRAIRLAMAEIRTFNPRAALIQTEDLGRTSSTSVLAYQAKFDNERRWLGFDLLFGRVDSQHPLYAWMRSAGITMQELATFAEHPCPPDILGINHYVTSNRFIDERVEMYPDVLQGGNRLHRYADVESVRVGFVPFVAPEEVFREAWDRYRSPIAVTEAHLGCTREEQARWLAEIWSAGQGLVAAGADVRAITAWALLGAFDWNSLVTRDDGCYEPGVFDIRGGRPRPTALCGVLTDLGKGIEPSHPVLDSPGWWRRSGRVIWGGADDIDGQTGSKAAGSRVREILITGAGGTLGRAFAMLCERRGLSYRLLDRSGLDIADEGSVCRAIQGCAPWAVINAAGYCRVDDAESFEAACHRDNVLGPRLLARACARRGIPLVTFSSDLVFDGRARSPYRESDAVMPLNVYGCSKAQAEKDVLSAHPCALVVRTSAFFGPWDEYNFATTTLRTLARGDAIRAAADLTVSPTYIPDLVSASLDLMIDGAHGLWHLANPGETSWADFARSMARLRRYEPGLVEGVPSAELGLVATRPVYSALGSDQAESIMPPLEEALERYGRECALA